MVIGPFYYYFPIGLIQGYFYAFYFLPLFIFYKRHQKPFALLMPVFMTPFIFNSLSAILPPKKFIFINPPIQINLLDTQSGPSDQILWPITLLISLLI